MGWISIGKGRPRGVAAFLARRIGVLGLAAVVVIALFASGKSYLWCAPMQRAMSSCCCAAPDDAADLSEAAAAHFERDCCDVRVTGELPQMASERVAPLDVPPPLVSFADPTHSLDRARSVRPRLGSAPPPRATRYGRTWAGPRSASDACIALQVSRC